MRKINEKDETRNAKINKQMNKHTNRDIIHVYILQIYSYIGICR